MKNQSNNTPDHNTYSLRSLLQLSTTITSSSNDLGSLNANRRNVSSSDCLTDKEYLIGILDEVLEILGDSSLDFETVRQDELHHNTNSPSFSNTEDEQGPRQ